MRDSNSSQLGVQILSGISHELYSIGQEFHSNVMPWEVVIMQGKTIFLPVSANVVNSLNTRLVSLIWSLNFMRR